MKESPRSAWVLLIVLAQSFVSYLPAQTTDIGRSSIQRFLEVVRTVGSRWHDGRRRDVVRIAMEAVGASPSEAYSRPLDDQAEAVLSDAVRRFGRGDGDAATLRFMKQLDPWSSFLTPADWSNFQSSQRPDYSGVGMDLEKESDGSFTCWPYPGSSADRAGVKPGARLLAVDGRSTSGRSLYAIGAMVRGRRGTSVDLSVSGMLGLSSRLNITRAPAHVKTVFPEAANDGVQVVSISRFAESTPAELAAIIPSGGARELEIDLRYCSGGDLDAAVGAAGLFLPSGTLVGRIRRNNGDEVLRAPGGSKRPSRLTVRQGGTTASAAEVFIAGLVFNDACVTVGGRTKGKATTQDIIPLGNRGALLLTTGLIYGPDGRSWQGVGLSSSR